MDRKIGKYLNQLLPIFWLRPETALWRSIDCMLMDKEQPKGRGVDFGCGDGMLSYIMAGGKVADYDVFANVSGLSSFAGGADIYNSRVRVKPVVDSSALRYVYACGVDHKPGLIEKAGQCGRFYGELLVRDLNKPLAFGGPGFDWGFSNILYWLNDAAGALGGWGRAIRKGGRLYLFVPNEHFKNKAWLYYKAPHRGRKSYLNFFDRGYNPLVRHYYSGAKWEALFKKSGFGVVSHKPCLSDPVMDVWNIGTRPVSHLLIGMANRLRKSDRTAAKREWTEFFRKFFEPIIEREIGRRQRDASCAFHFYILENRR